MLKQVGILGGGSFATAMAQHLAHQGLRVTLWMRNPALADSINKQHCNTRYFPQAQLHPELRATTVLQDVMAHNHLLFFALPTQCMRSMLLAMQPYLQPQHHLLLGCKGIDPDSLQTMEEVVVELWGEQWQHKTMVLSGPSFAAEILAKQPTAVVIACREESLAARCCQLFFAPHFRAYTSTDVMGVEIAGALKNVIAIAAGAITGLALGQNARAAFVTRGLAEMARFVRAKGGKPITLLGLSGVGDLLLTCTGSYSRNRALGEALGRGANLGELQPRLEQVTEGVRTCQAAFTLAQKLKIRAPLTTAVYRVLFENASAQSLLNEILLQQPQGDEFG